MALEDTERTDHCFGAGQSGPTFLYFSNIPQFLTPTNSTPTVHLPVTLSGRKRHEALTCEGETVWISRAAVCLLTLCDEMLYMCAVNTAATHQLNWTTQIKTVL